MEKIPLTSAAFQVKVLTHLDYIKDKQKDHDDKLKSVDEKISKEVKLLYDTIHKKADKSTVKWLFGISITLIAAIIAGIGIF